MSSIGKNFFYSSLLTSANYVFPLIVFPYVNRVLGVDNIGICNFVDSIVNYFVLFSSLGVGLVGIREIAKTRGNNESTSKVFSSILYINFLATIFAVILFVACIHLIPKFSNYRELMYVGVIKLSVNFLLVEWLYKGLEEFKYITIRSLIIKTLYVISVFVFVRSRNDTFNYFLLTCLLICTNALINCAYARRIVNFSVDKEIVISVFKPILLIGLYSIMCYLYNGISPIVLGFVSDDAQVGYFATATKIYTIMLSVFTAFTNVMMPRMSSIAKTDPSKFLNYLNISSSVLFSYFIPLSIFCVIFAPEIIILLAGQGFEGAILPMRIVMLLIVIVSYEQIIIMQGLMPLGKDRDVLTNAFIGGVTGVILNLLLVYNFLCLGAAVSWVLSEIFVLTLSQHSLGKYVVLKFPFRLLSLNLLLYSPLIILFLFISTLHVSSLFLLIIGGSLMFLYVFVLQYNILKEPSLVKIVGNVMKKFNY